MNISSYLYLDSDDRDNKPNPNVVDVTFPVNFRGNAVQKIALSSYDFSIALDNINELTQTCYVDDGTTTYPCTMPIGTYDIFQFRDEALLVLNALGLGVWTITYVNGQARIVAPVPVKFITNPVRPNGRDWADMYGLEKDTELTQFHNSGVVDLAYTNKLYITSQDVHRFKTMADESSVRRITDCLGVVYVNPNTQLGLETVPLSPEGVYPHRVTREINVPKYIMHRKESDLGVIRIIILDDRGERIPESQVSKMRWSLELLVEN